ncbi:MAG: NUDIX hydrolase [Halofilum sp. (in: g-proteobacteria)]|nr:NUDIX hydrolase [Halofilum sp. (in: g-proteobacteria)]
MYYCPDCGSSRIDWRIPADDNRERHVCGDCGNIHYQNPRNVAGCIVEHEGRLLLCRRAIEPRRGLWTVPAGFMENHETLEQAAARETREEALAEVRDLSLYAVFSLPHISQVYVLFRATSPDGSADAGPESLDVDWFTERQIPWDTLAFPVIREGLRLYCEDRRRGHHPVRTGSIERVEDGSLRVYHEAIG